MSSWTDAGFPDSFRFRSHLHCVRTMYAAALERGLASGSNMELTDDTFQLFEEKWWWHYGDPYGYVGTRLRDYLSTGILDIAGCFCDPEKAYDFENYPELENWTKDSLKEKLGKDYIEYSPFVDKDKWAMFVYKVLNLCYTRRVPVYSSSRDRFISGPIFRSAEGNSADLVLTRLRNSEWREATSTCFGSQWRVDVSEGFYYISQNAGGLGIRYNQKSPCKISFYTEAVKGECDVFSALGATDHYGNPVTADRMFLAGVVNPEQVTDGVSAYVRFRFPDSAMPALPDRLSTGTYITGFDLKEFSAQDGNVTVGYAVCDHLKHFKYLDIPTKSEE